MQKKGLFTCMQWIGCATALYSTTCNMSFYYLINGLIMAGIANMVTWSFSLREIQGAVCCTKDNNRPLTVVSQ